MAAAPGEQHTESDAEADQQRDQEGVPPRECRNGRAGPHGRGRPRRGCRCGNVLARPGGAGFERPGEIPRILEPVGR